ncbi:MULTISPECIES: hypothetical protein [Vibrio]|uniref:hypothetical protein n=1 Tax=Vibrio TaxID=662 RepID=UPI0020754EF4|nr:MULTISPECIES: hypothetical protein [Vibrio]USD35483.1 hypothetical protein J8Z27_22960 [Vibrio sp. SCSIO 43186]USD72607.1 hypothetical protein J4N41_22965 [Vibrio sp. SCSIO 43139]USD98998.1 hypothetical protein CTT30_23275 [Vibrio coralliilyticus]
MLEQKSKSYIDYVDFKDKYIGQYGSHALNYFRTLEGREDWSVKVEIEELLHTFSRLPVVCKKPFNEHDAALITYLIRLLAYLPFVDGITALAYLGVENDQYGHAIYEMAYEASMFTPPCSSSKTIVERVSVVQRVAIIQTIQGRKL